MARDAALWLTPGQQDEWVDSKKQVAFHIFASFIAWTIISRVSMRILNRKAKPIKDPGNQALLRYGATSATHAIISLLASLYILMRRDLSHCGSQAFCHDDLSARLWCMHAGYALYEFLFWQNCSSLVKPWNEMVLLHNVVWILQAVASLLYPCRLSLVLLPLQEMLQVATLVDCVRRFMSIYGAPWHMRFKTLLLFMVVFSAKAVGGAALTAFTFYWLRKYSVWTLQLPEGMSSVNQVYGIIFLAGSCINFMIYLKWAGAAVDMTNNLVAAVQGQNKKEQDAAAALSYKAAATGNRKKKDRRR